MKNRHTHTVDTDTHIHPHASIPAVSEILHATGAGRRGAAAAVQYTTWHNMFKVVAPHVTAAMCAKLLLLSYHSIHLCTPP